MSKKVDFLIEVEGHEDKSKRLVQCRGCTTTMKYSSFHQHMRRFEKCQEKYKLMEMAENVGLPTNWNLDTTAVHGNVEDLVEGTEAVEGIAQDIVEDTATVCDMEAEGSSSPEYTSSEDERDPVEVALPTNLVQFGPLTEEDFEDVYLGAITTIDEEVQPSPASQPTSEEQPTNDMVSHYKSKLTKPLYVGARIRLVDAIFFLLKMKFTARLGNSVLDSLIHSLANFFLPPGNILPPTLHLCKRVLEVDKWDAKERHVCDNETCKGHLFP